MPEVEETKKTMKKKKARDGDPATIAVTAGLKGKIGAANPRGNDRGGGEGRGGGGNEGRGGFERGREPRGAGPRGPGDRRGENPFDIDLEKTDRR